MPFPVGIAIGTAGGLLGGILGNRASAGQASRNRDFQKHMFRHRYQYTVEDMRRAGLNPALAYEQGGGSAPSGSTASQEDPLAGGIEAAMRGVSTAMQVKQVKAQVAKTEADTRLTNAQAKQLESEAASRAEWWRVRPMTEQGRQAQMGASVRKDQLVIDFLDQTMKDRVAIAGYERQEMEVLLKQMNLDLELAGLQRAPLEAQAKFAKSWFGQNVAPAMGSASGVAGILSGVISAFLRYKEGKSAEAPKTTIENRRFFRGGSTTTRRSW